MNNKNVKINTNAEKYKPFYFNFQEKKTGGPTSSTTASTYWLKVTFSQAGVDFYYFNFGIVLASHQTHGTIKKNSRNSLVGNLHSKLQSRKVL